MFTNRCQLALMNREWEGNRIAEALSRLKTLKGRDDGTNGTYRTYESNWASRGTKKERTGEWTPAFTIYYLLLTMYRPRCGHRLGRGQVAGRGGLEAAIVNTGSGG